MTSVADIIYDEAAPFERALAKASSDVLPVPIRQILDPAVTPKAFLPFLAVHESTDLWFDDWPEARKRLMVARALELAALTGTRAGVEKFLPFVDGELIDKISYPTRFVFGRSAIGRVPIGHPPYLARHLVRVPTFRPPRSVVMGRSVLGRTVLRAPTREPIRRCLVAMATAKAPETEYRASFAHKRHILVSDAIPVDDTHRVGEFIDRVRL